MDTSSGTLQFVYEPDASKATIHLQKRLQQELQAGKRVLWLVCGGSNISLSAQIINQLVEELPQELLGQLTCLLSDERYGMPDHADSNYRQLREAGFMVDGLQFEPVLQPDLTIEDTCSRYAETVVKTMDAADVIIGQPGVGGDGHIAGILPRSAAVTDDQLVVGYNAGVFQRITLTPPLLRRVDAVYAYVYGETKRHALQRLRDETLPLSEQPAQILKEVPEAYIYTDQQLDTETTTKEATGEAA